MHRPGWRAAIAAALLAGVALPGVRPAEAAPATGSEVAVAPDGTGAQTASDVASDGTNRLAVWVDGRNGNPDIYAARIRPDGTSLDPAGIAVATGAASQRAPSVAFDGVRFLVAWTVGPVGSENVRAARVSTAGVVLDPSGITIRATAASEKVGAVARNGDGFLVTWVGADVGLRATRVSTAGVVLDASGIALSLWSGASTAAWNGTSTLLAWGVLLSSGHGRQLWALRVTPQGTVLDSSPIVVADYPGDALLVPDVDATGSGWLAVTAFGRTDGTLDVAGALVASNGDVTDSSIPLPDGGGTEDQPTVACTASCLVAWREEGDVHAARVEADGDVLDPDGFVVAGSPSVEADPAAVSGPEDGWSVAYTRLVTSGPPASTQGRVFVRAVAPK